MASSLPVIAGLPVRHPGVSVIIPCYRQAHFLAQAIDSVLAQDAGAIEIVVINDGSPDDTAQVAARYGDRIRYHAQANQGLSPARNAGLRLATKEFLHFLDSDDFVRPGFYKKLSAVLAQRPEAVAAYSGFQWVDAAGRFVGELPPEPETADWFHRLLESNPWPPNALLVRATALAEAGSEPFEVKLRSCEDWDLWLRLAMRGGKFAAANEFVGVCYRKHPQSMSTNPWVMLETGMSVITQNANRHGNCALCRVALTRGREHMRRLCFEEKMIPQLGRLLENGQVFRHLRGCARALSYDPASAWRGLMLLRHQKRRALAGLNPSENK